MGRNDQELGQTRPSTSMTHRHTENKKNKEGRRERKNWWVLEEPKVGWALVEQRPPVGRVVRAL